MKAVILAGGLGTRISEESNIRPKPMIEIGGKPILWHIMKIYSYYGINEFVICAGYKSYYIKEYFFNYFLHQNDLEINLNDNTYTFRNNQSENWKVNVIDTGLDTQTGGRLKRVKDYLKDEENFCLTYGDGLGNINIAELINQHKSNNMLATLTSYAPPNRFGILKTSGANVVEFLEKPQSDDALINAGFFILSPKVIDLIEDDLTVWEQYPLKKLAKDKQLGFYRHDKFWHPMDTLRDKNYLENLWNNGEAPWKVW